ncbi:MAG: hypothetical protein RIT28_1265 [Pseudomonadota bacterium]|jgi:hypothetical protein
MSGDSNIMVHVSPQTRRVEDARARLRQAQANTQVVLNTLHVEIEETLDWRTWVRARPAPVLITAFFLGFLIGSRR